MPLVAVDDRYDLLDNLTDFPNLARTQWGGTAECFPMCRALVCADDDGRTGRALRLKGEL